MLGVPDAGVAAAWYRQALGAEELWNLGSVIGLAIGNAPFFLHEPTDAGFHAPTAPGRTTVRIEVLCDDPDALVARALAAGAAGSLEHMRVREAPWGSHRQGSFTDPFGHVWLVGDMSPIRGAPRP